jgi:hypothetical protein
MRSLQQLEKEARDRRTQFAATLLDFQSRLTLPGLADEALRHFDPHFTRLPPVYLAVKRHPLLAASALAGVSWLFKQALQKNTRSRKNGKDSSHERTRVRPPITSVTEKEHIHEID